MLFAKYHPKHSWLMSPGTFYVGHSDPNSPKTPIACRWAIVFFNSWGFAVADGNKIDDPAGPSLAHAENSLNDGTIRHRTEKFNPNGQIHYHLGMMFFEPKPQSKGWQPEIRVTLPIKTDHAEADNDLNKALLRIACATDGKVLAFTEPVQ